jgi:hypothetical protein
MTVKNKLNVEALSNKFEELLKKHGYQPEHTAIESIVKRPDNSVVGEMMRQFICLSLEFQSGCPDLQIAGHSSPLDSIEEWLKDYCHAPGMLIGEFLKDGPLQNDTTEALLLFAALNSMPMPKTVINDVASQIVGYAALHEGN